MPFEAFNADGDPIEGVLPPEEIKTLQTKLEETNQKLSKLENKEFNFRKLEQMTEEEKGKLTATELSLKKQAEELETKQSDFQKTFVSDVKNDLLVSVAGDDEELRKKIAFNYDRIKDSDKATSREQIKALINDAYAMSAPGKRANPILGAVNASGNGAAPKSEKVSEDLASVGAKLGLSAEDLKNIK